MTIIKSLYNKIFDRINYYIYIYGNPISKLNHNCKKILFVCKGNVCRSPMAEYVTKKSALINELNELKIYSRGIDVSINKPADEYAIHICNKNGIDISGHISKSIDDNDIYLSDIIVAMDYYQLKYMKIKYPTQAHKIILLTCYYKYSLYTIKNLGIKDPYGRPIDIFEESFIVISECIENLIRYIMCASER